MSKLLDLSPKSSFSSAPILGRAIYLALFLLALTLQVAAVSRGGIFNAELSIPVSVLIFFGAIFVHDFGLMVLRQKPAARKGLLASNVILIFTLTQNGREVNAVALGCMIIAASAYLLTHTPTMREYLKKAPRPSKA